MQQGDRVTAWLSGNSVTYINEVHLHQAELVVTTEMGEYSPVYHLCQRNSAWPSIHG